MKKFKYRAESYFKFLKHQREGALRDLKQAEGYRNNLLSQYSRMEDKMRESYQINSEVGQEGRDIRYINDNNQFIEMLKVQMKNLSMEIQMAEDEYQKKHKALLELQLKVKKMELHKELEYDKFKKEYRKKTQKMTDEINSTRRRGEDAESV